MFGNGFWGGNITVPGTGGGGGGTTDLTPLLERLTALETTDLLHQTQLDDLDLSLKMLRDEVHGSSGGDTGGDDPGSIVGELSLLRQEVTLQSAAIADVQRIQGENYERNEADHGFFDTMFVDFDTQMVSLRNRMTQTETRLDHDFAPAIQTAYNTANDAKAMVLHYHPPIGGE